MCERVNLRRSLGQLCREGVRLLLCALLGGVLFANVVARQKGAGVRPTVNPREERRVALVIGNSNYEQATGRLKNPVNDASDVVAALRSLDFEIVGGKAQLDVSLRQMDELVRAFGREIRRGGVGVFYYSGHGIQVNRLNYLLPLDSRIEKEQDVPFEALNIDRVLAEMEAAENRLNILILDACRNNPLTRGFRSAGKGLARPENVPTGTYVAFAARDGQAASDNAAGRNGLYTQELLKNIVRPGLRLEDIFINTRREVRRLSQNAQIPVEYGSIDAPFFFIEGDSTAGLGHATASPTPIDNPSSQPSSGSPPPTPNSSPVSGTDKLVGESYVEARDYDWAIANYTRAIEKDATSFLSYLNRGYLYVRYKKDYDRAIADFTKLIDMRLKKTSLTGSATAAAYYWRGDAYVEKGNYDSAIADTTQSIKMDSNAAHAYFVRGKAYYNKQIYDRAIADFTKAIERYPKSDIIELYPALALTYKNRALAYDAKGDSARAAADRQRAAELEKRQP